MRHIQSIQHSWKHPTFQHEFVECIPDHLEDGTIYVCLDYGTAVHKCACGCGRQVVTPLSPKDWKLTYDGETISLYPSIGNWQFPCRSHYWLANSMAKAAFYQDEERESKKKRKKKKKPFNWLNLKSFFSK